MTFTVFFLTEKEHLTSQKTKTQPYPLAEKEISLLVS